MFTHPVAQKNSRGHHAGADTKDADDNIDIRAAMIIQAEALIGNKSNNGWGEKDLANILHDLLPKFNLHKYETIRNLKKTADSCGAFSSNGIPEAGDIVLFHNQVDTNKNQKFDDWLTGAGIVIKNYRHGFEAIARTGNLPRRIKVWPNGPAVDRLDGEKINSFVKIPRRSDPVDAEYLAGQLYAGHINIEKFYAATK